MQPSLLPDLRQPVPRVVGTIHTLEGLAAAEHLTAGDLDILELRADLLQDHLQAIEPRLACLAVPVVLTVRAEEEGGRGPKNLQERAKIYRQLLKNAHWVDIELFIARELQEGIAGSGNFPVPLILSFHDFAGTPPLEVLREKVHQAAGAGAALCKLATTTHTTRDLCVLLELLALPDLPVPLSVMGMGKFGKISRPLLAQAGSRLNYGWVGQPLVSGQWPAQALKKLLGQLEP